MKKILTLFALAAACLCSASAQEFVYQIGKESKHADPEMIYNGHYLGMHNGLDCWITQSEKGTNIFVRNRDWQVVHLDSNLVPVGTLELPLTSRAQHLASVMQGSRTAALLVDSSSDERTLILKYVVDMDSMRLVGDKFDTVNDFTYSDDDHCMVWAATSPDGNHIALVSVIEFTKTKKYTANITMFNSAFEQEWNRQYALNSTEQVYVDNTGRIVTLGVEEDGETQHFIFNILDAVESDSYDISIKCDRVLNMRILNIIGPHVVCAGLFSPVTSDPKEGLIGGVVGMAFNLDSTNVTGFSMRPFQNEDMNIFMNKKTKKIQREQTQTFIVPVDIAPTAFGGAMAAGKNYTQNRINNNGTISSAYCAIGLHIVAVDTNGNIKWVRNIRRNDFTDEEKEELNVSLVPTEDQIFLLKTENRKYPSHYDIAKDAPELEIGDKANIVLYSISNDGDVKKTLVEHKTKHHLLAVDTRANGTMLLLTKRGSKTRMAKLTH